jgi:hypothetical protein
MLSRNSTELEAFMQKMYPVIIGKCSEDIGQYHAACG